MRFCLQLSNDVMVSSLVRLHCLGALTAALAAPSIHDIQVDPNNLLSPDVVADFQKVNAKFREVFKTKGKLYNGSFGSLEAVVNMGPSLLPQGKARVSQYGRDKLMDFRFAVYGRL